MRIRQELFRLTTALVAVSLVLGPVMPTAARAQPAPTGAPSEAPQPGDVDPPARVGRLARVSGTVSFHAAEADHWDPAQVNWPVSSGNAFWADQGGSAEIELPNGRVMMDSGTEFDVDTLDDHQLASTLRQGQVYFRVAGLAPGDSITVATPRGQAAISAPGRYQIAAGDTDNPTRLTVYEGAATIGGQSIPPGQSAEVTGTDNFAVNLVPAPASDPFLAAAEQREQVRRPVGGAPPPPQVAQMPGGQDLGGYGTWTSTPQYGSVWYPQVAPGWAPYRTGHWAFVPPWGWTWIDDAPWGFAPFHYGRWVEVGGLWAWAPGVGAGRLLRSWRGGRHHGGRGRLDSAGLARAVPPLVPREPGLLSQHQRGSRYQHQHQQQREHARLPQQPWRNGGAGRRDDRIAPGRVGGAAIAGRATGAGASGVGPPADPAEHGDRRRNARHRAADEPAGACRRSRGDGTPGGTGTGDSWYPGRPASAARAGAALAGATRHGRRTAVRRASRRHPGSTADPGRRPAGIAAAGWPTAARSDPVRRADSACRHAGGPTWRAGRGAAARARRRTGAASRGSRGDADGAPCAGRSTSGRAACSVRAARAATECRTTSGASCRPPATRPARSPTAGPARGSAAAGAAHGTAAPCPACGSATGTAHGSATAGTAHGAATGSAPGAGPCAATAQTAGTPVIGMARR
jgi:hypothetical protein